MKPDKKRGLTLLALMLIMAMTFMLAACGAETGTAGEGTLEAASSEAEEAAAEDAEDEADADADADGAADAGDEAGAAADDLEVVDSLVEIDTEDMLDIPLQIDSITLYEDGSLAIVPREDLLKNAETNNEVVNGAVYPFADSGKVEAFYLVRYGNGGYRTVICLMEDGTLSALSANELIQDHIFIVMDAITGRDTYTSVVQTQDEDAFGVIGVTEDGQEIELDFSLDF